MRFSCCAIALVVSLAAFGRANAGPQPTVLTLSGPRGTETFTMKRLRAYWRPPETGRAALRDSTGTIAPSSAFRGVMIRVLLEDVGWPVDWDCVVTTADHRRVVLDYEHLFWHRFPAYDPRTGGPPEANVNLIPTLAWERDGAALAPERDGPLRIVLLTPQGYATDEEWSVASLTRLDVVPGSHWSLRLHGALQERIEPALFDSLLATGAESWKDESSHVWTGLSLKQLVGRVDDRPFADSLEDSLAARGYVVSVDSADLTTSELVHSRLLLGRDPLILAVREDGLALRDGDAPIRLVGPSLKLKERLGHVVSIALYSPDGLPFRSYPDPPW